MGRKAYEECGIRHIDGWQEKRFFVASHRPRPADAPPNVEFFCGGLAEKVEDLKRCAQGGIWLFGGGQVASALISAGLVDELSLIHIFSAAVTAFKTCSGRRSSMKAYNKKTFAFGVFSTALGVLNAVTAALRGADAGDIVLIACLLFFGIGAMLRGTSKRLAREDGLEELDERCV